MALLENLRDRGITTFATTHYSDLKLYAHNTPGVRNASMEFDVESLSPTYELSIGLPGRSQALTIARRLGLNPVIVEQAEAIVRPDTLQADALLEDIKRAKMEALTAAERASERERQAQLAETDLRTSWPRSKKPGAPSSPRRASSCRSSSTKPRKELDQLRRQARSQLCPPARASPPGGCARRFPGPRRQGTGPPQAGHRRGQPPRRGARRHGEGLTGPIEVGDRVWVATLQASGEVLAVYPASSEADVQLGNFRLKLPLKRLELRQKAAKDVPPPRANVAGGARRSAPAPAWSLICAANASRPASKGSNAILTMPIWLACPGRASFTATAPAPCVPPYATSCAATRWSAQMRSGEGNEGGDGVTVVKLVSA